jgi:hypothetical protein
MKFWKVGMFNCTVSLVFLLSLISAAQQPLSKTEAKSVPKPSAQASDVPVSASALSKDYRKSAISALSSIDDWKQKAMAITHSTAYSNGTVSVNRSYAEREADAHAKAEKDVKMATVDEATSADRFLQERFVIYLEAVKGVNSYYRHPFGSEQPSKKDRDTVATCGALIEKALDEGTTTVFEKHPEMKCE